MLPSGPYNPADTEARILKFWLEHKFYKPEYSPAEQRVLTDTEFVQDQRESFAIILPPPNANGNLHLGHMSGYAYQDLMGRYNRMRGKKVLLLPGKDHAGIQTEVVFEQELIKRGIDKKEMDRDDFYRQCYEFCIKNAETARRQEQNIGLSADYDRELFTLDPKVVTEVLTAFKLMYEDELIYRGKRLINWCVRCQSALADIDTEFKDAKSKFFYFKYAFTQPEAKALQLKQDFAGKETLWKVTASSETKPYLLGERHNGVEILGIGYDQVPVGTEVNGIVIGIQMRLDNKFRLVVKGIDFDGEINAEVVKATLAMMKDTAGAHIILFDEYPEDKFYTNGFILGTVRPETKFGDTALAVDPSDERYAEFVGNQYDVVTLNGIAKINVIADRAVDKDFGTGMVKITPAHAMEDWEIAQRHPAETMPEKQVIGFDGKLNHLTGKYEGMKVKEAREAMIPDMKAIGMLIYIDEGYENRIRICERCKHPIEPLVSHQWFVNTRPLKQKAKELVEQGFTKILPEGKERVYLNWMDNEEDWCITRQLWWGYRLPVWYKGGKEQYVSESGEVKEKINGKLIENTSDYAGLMYVGLDKPEGDDWIQDSDVLDTWFSSGQWPFVTLNTKPGDYAQFYPTQVMETGWDILIFWVTRMMLLNPYRAEKAGAKTPQAQIPFSNVYLHGLVLDKNGVKMSKSKGNGIDPFEMMQKYGTDALRYSFIIGNSAGQNYRLYEEKIDAYKKFCNKIWNATRFVLGNMPETMSSDLVIDGTKLQFESNKNLYEHIQSLHQNITHLLDTFQFGVAAQVLHDEFWHSFCDKFLEEAKPHIYPQKDKATGAVISEPTAAEKAETLQVLLFGLQAYIKMLHPFMPFITEEIWQHMPGHTEKDTVMYAQW